MKTYKVIFSPEAEEQLAALYRYIAVEASPNIAERYTDAIVTYCEGLTNFRQPDALYINHGVKLNRWIL